MKSMPFEVWGDETPSGWKEVVTPLIEYCQTNNIPILQVKEKFARLRMYVGSSPDEAVNEELDRMLEQAERESAQTCMECGRPGEQRVRCGWMYVSCEEHARSG